MKVDSLGRKRIATRKIGEGYIGLERFGFIMNDKRLKDAPKVIETPKGDDGKSQDIINLKRLRSLLK